MNQTQKLVLALAAAAVIAALVLGLLVGGKDSGAVAALAAPAEESDASRAEPAPEPVESALAAEPGADARSAVQGADEESPAAAAAPPVPDTAVVARILDENLRPIPGAWLRVDDAGEEARDPAASSRAATSDREGLVTLQWLGEVAQFPVLFAAGAEGRATVFPRGLVVPAEVLHLGDLVLPPGCVVSGRVVDERERPVAGAKVVVSNPQDLWQASDLERLRSMGPELYFGAPLAHSAADGAFRVEGVPAGVTRAWARSQGSLWAVSPPLEVVGRSELRDVRLVIGTAAELDPALARIEGIVLGPGEKPVPEARINVRQRMEGTSWSHGDRADAGGRFRVTPRDRSVRISLGFEDPEQRWTSVQLEDVKPGTQDLVVRLEEPRTFVLAVRDEDGPLTGYRVHWGKSEGSMQGAANPDDVHPEGRALVRVPCASCWFRVESPGHLPEDLGPFDARSLPAEFSLTLHSVPGIHGRVLAGEQPVPGATVSLHEQPGHTQIEVNGFASLVDPDVVSTATTDAAGEFRLELQRDARFTLFADAAGYARAQHGPLELEAQRGLRDLVLRLDAGGTLEGKVLMPPGRQPAGVIVSINRGDARPLTQVVGPEGTFRFEHLAAGTWELARAQEVFHHVTSTSMSSGDELEPRTIRNDFTIASGQTTRVDLDLRHSAACVLEITLTNNGQPAQAWKLVAWPDEKHTWSGVVPNAVTDSNGRARIEVEDPGACSLRVSPPPEAGSGFETSFTITLQRGPNPWSGKVETGRIQGQVIGWQPDAGVRLLAVALGEAGGQLEIEPDATGSFVLPLVLAGRVQVRKRSPGANWETVSELQLGAGETRPLQIP